MSLAPAAAFAHATLVATEPADGAVVAAPPEAVTLVFNEPVAPLVLRLFDPSGHATALSDVRQDGPRLVVAVPRDRGEGTFVVSWRVVSADGHPIGGAFGYSVGRADGAARAALESAASAPVRVAIWLTRVALYVALFAGAGGAVFAAWIAAPCARAGGIETIVAGAAWCGLALLPLAVGLQGLDALGVPLSELQRPTVWTTGFATAYGATAVVAAIALLAALFALQAPQPARARRLSAVAMLAVGIALAASGHAAAAAPQWLMRPAVFVHALAVTFWIGSLLPLGAALRAGGEEARRTLQRFSRAAPLAVAALVVSGALLVVIQLASLDALWRTEYGLVLLRKLVVVAILLVLAAINRFYLTPKITAQDGRARAWLVRSIAVEVVLALAILALVASWRFTPPPRALAQASATIAVHAHGPRVFAHVEIALTAGGGQVVIRLTDPKLDPLPAKEVTLVLANETAGIEPLQRAATSLGDGRWRVDDLLIPVAGTWRVRVDVLVSDFEKIVVEQMARLPRMP
jgi:copper transport protein